MLDEQPIQFSRSMVAHLVGTHFQNVASLLEPRQPRSKHNPDIAGPGLASEVDWLAPGRLRHFYALLRKEVPAAFEGGGRSAGVAATRGARERAGRVIGITTMRISLWSRAALSARWQKTRRCRHRGTAAAAIAILSLLSGCVFGKHRTAHNNLTPGGPWGYYSGAIDTRWDADGRTMTLLTEL